MTYYLNESEWMNSRYVPEGMNLDMLNNNLDSRLNNIGITNTKYEHLLDDTNRLRDRVIKLLI